MSSLVNGPLDGDVENSNAPLVSTDAHLATDPASRPTRVRYIALAWLTTAVALAYLCRNAIGVPERAIREELGLSLTQSGFLQGAFFWSYAILQVPGGWFAQRRGTRIALSVFAIAWSIAMIEMSVAPVFWLLVVAQLVMGSAQAGMLPAAYNSIGHWMPVSQRAFGCGVLAAGMQIGAISASMVTARLLEPLGWRRIFLLLALPGILWALGFWIWFRNRPAQSPSVNSSELALIIAGREKQEIAAEVVADESTELTTMLRSPVVWWLCGQQIFRAAGYMFFVSWLPTFLQTTRGVSIETSGYMQSAILAAMLPGTILSGVVTDWIWRRTGDLRLSRSGVAMTSLLICALSFCGAWLAVRPELTVGFLAIGGFFGALGGPCAFAAAIDIAGPRVPQVAGFINMSGNFAAAACPYVVGKLFAWSPNWNLILLVFAIIYFCSAVCWMNVNPNNRIGGGRIPGGVRP